MLESESIQPTNQVVRQHCKGDLSVWKRGLGYFIDRLDFARQSNNLADRLELEVDAPSLPFILTSNLPNFSAKHGK